MRIDRARIEAVLADMIRAGGFEFMITTDDRTATVYYARRTPAVQAAIKAAYPIREQVNRDLWINLRR